MKNIRIPILFTPKKTVLCLPELDGHAEMAAVSSATNSVIDVLNSLIEKMGGRDRVRAENFVTADRDRILAALYISVFGSRLQSTVSCSSCHEPFDIEFRLEQLQQWIETQENEIPKFLPDTEGFYQTAEGKKFRLPTGEDELVVADMEPGLAEETLLRRCTSEGSELSPDDDFDSLQEAMKKTAPLLSTELNVVCPECHMDQEVSFDMQSFFMNRLVGERRLLFHEIHSLAKNYHWHFKEILDLRRSARKELVAVMDREN